MEEIPIAAAANAAFPRSLLTTDLTAFVTPLTAPETALPTLLKTLPSPYCSLLTKLPSPP